MEAELVLTVVEQGVATITLNRPERLNAINPEMNVLLQQRLQEAARDREVGCIVLTGAGRAFCAGGDVTRMVDGGPPPGYEDDVRDQQERHGVITLIHELPKPVIAMVKGVAAGAGVSLAAACDLRIAAAGARFTTAFMRVGFSGDYGGTWLLTQLVGTAKARELYFTSEQVGAEEALRIGLVNRVVPDEQLGEQTLALARQIAAGPSIALAYMKENLNLALHARLSDVLAAEAKAQRRTAQTEDHAEGARAFVEKRPPVFRGR
jgi:2-(1,2-epoxy-1,2-dihydrophenyl)acetyl-CoA isomerase